MSTMFDYLAGPGDCQFFQELFATPDSNIVGDETPKQALTKHQKRLSHLYAIKATVDSPGMQILMEIMLLKVKQHDNEIHTAVLKGDNVAIQRIAIERSGIMALFDQLNGLTEGIQQTTEQIELLNNGADPQQQLSEDLE